MRRDFGVTCEIGMASAGPHNLGMFSILRVAYGGLDQVCGLGINRITNEQKDFVIIKFFYTYDGLNYVNIKSKTFKEV